MSALSTARLGVQGSFALDMDGTGGAKVAGAETMNEDFDRFGYLQWFRQITGGIELTAGIVLIGGLFVAPVVALAGALVVAIALIGAVFTHVRVEDSASDTAPATILLVFALIAIWYHAGAR